MNISENMFGNDAIISVTPYVTETNEQSDWVRKN